MNVIFGPADGVNENAVLLADACKVRPKQGLMKFTDELAAVLCAEYEVDRDLGVCMRHVSHLRRLTAVYIMDPALAGWANFCRTSGALRDRNRYNIPRRI